MKNKMFVRKNKASGEIEYLERDDAEYRTLEFKNSIERMLKGEVLESDYNFFFVEPEETELDIDPIGILA
jgi:hypothetical protein